MPAKIWSEAFYKFDMSLKTLSLQINLSDFDLTFSLKTLSQRGTEMFQEEGPLQALTDSEMVEPLTGQDGKKFHVIDCRVNISNFWKSASHENNTKHSE